MLLFGGLLLSFCLCDLLLSFLPLQKKKPVGFFLNWHTLLVEFSCLCQAVPAAREGHCIRTQGCNTQKLCLGVSREDEGVGLRPAQGGPYPLCVRSATCTLAALYGDKSPSQSGPRGKETRTYK